MIAGLVGLGLAVACFALLATLRHIPILGSRLRQMASSSPDPVAGAPWTSALLAAGLLLMVAWLVRYDMQAVSASNSAVAFRLDRWTGAVEWCGPSQCQMFGERD
jgi:H+/Cl- antiporter ClcA